MRRKGVDWKALGQNMAALRQRRGMTQAELARRAGCSVSFVSRVERGTTGLSAVLFFKLCNALDCRASDMLRRTE